MRNTKLIKGSLIRYGTTYWKLSNRLSGLFDLLALSQLVHLLYELLNRLNGIFYPLILLRLVVQTTKQDRQNFLPSGTFTTCSITKHQIG